MRILLDTHVFLWWDSDPGKLSARVNNLLSDPENTIVLSVVSVWEIQIKKQLGKLSLSIPLDELLESQQQVNELEILPVNLEHVLMLENLPSVHKDPFDRMPAAQAKAENLTIMRADPTLASYDIEIVW